MPLTNSLSDRDTQLLTVQFVQKHNRTNVHILKEIQISIL
jgi:hypothetical protein